MLNFNNSHTFELVIDILDMYGKPSGKKKNISSDKADKISEFWNRNRGHRKKKRRKTDDKVANKTQANKILKNMYGDSN